MIDAMMSETDSAQQLDSNFAIAEPQSLTIAQGLALLTRLIEDDAFRARFESAPAASFAEIGVCPETIAGLKAACLAPRKLAPSAVLESARQRLADDLDMSTLVLSIPSAMF